MAETADVVIVGGGVIGLSIAYHLAKRGVRNVTIVEAGICGSGATLKATGGVRHQFGTAINVRQSLLARPFWLTFDEEFDIRGTFRQIGYLFLATTPEVAAGLARNVSLQTGLGVPARIVSPEEARGLAPGLVVDDVVNGAFCPWDGALVVDQVVAGLVAGCRRAGVRVMEQTTVQGVTVEHDRVTGVTSTAGPIAAPIVVNAAGNLAATVGRLAGVELPVRPERRQAGVTVPTTAIDPAATWTIDLGSGCYARPESEGGAVIGGGDRGADNDLPADVVDDAGIARMRHLVGRRFPDLADVPLRRAWVGQRPMSPDDHVIVGTTEVEGFLVACGPGSHGLMHAPAIGLLLAELIVDGATTSMDIGPLAPGRFARGDLLTESVLF